MVLTRIDITQRTADRNVRENPQLRGQPLHVQAKLPGKNFRLFITVKGLVGDELNRALDKAFRTGVFPFAKFLQPQVVSRRALADPRADILRGLASQKLKPGTIRGLQRTGQITREQASKLARGQRLATITPKKLAAKIARISGVPFAIKRPPASLTKFGAVFAPRRLSSTELSGLSSGIAREGRILDQRIKSGTASQKEVTRFNRIVGAFNKRVNRAEAQELRKIFKEKPSPRKPSKITPRDLPGFIGDLRLEEAIPIELGGKGVSFVKSAKEFGDTLVNLGGKLPPKLKKLERTRSGTIRGVGNVIGAGFAAFETLRRGVVFGVQETVKLGGVAGILRKSGVKVFASDKLLQKVRNAQRFDSVVITNPIKFIRISKDSLLFTPRAVGEFAGAAFDVVLIFDIAGGRGVASINKVKAGGKVGSQIGKIRFTTKTANISNFAKIKVKNLRKLSTIIKQVPEIKAIRIRVREDVKAFVGVKKAITSTKINAFLSSVNKELRPLRKKLGPIIKEIKLSQKGLAPKKTAPSELRRLSSSQVRVIQTEKLNAARVIVNKTLRNLFLTRNVRKKFGPVTRIIKLGRKKGLSPSGSVLRFAREKAKNFVDPRRKQLNAVGIDVNSFGVNLTNDLVKKLFPRKLARSLKKKFPELSKQLAIGKKRGVRKRVIVGRVVKRRTIVILNRTFLSQRLAIKFFRRQFVKEVREVTGLFRTLSNVSKATVKREFNNFLSATRLIKKMLKQPRILLTEREIRFINKWNISRVNFLEKVGILFGKKIPRKIRKKLGGVIKTIKLSEKGSKEFVKRIKASSSLLTIKLKSLFNKLSSGVKSRVRERHVAALQRAFQTRRSIVKKILGKQLDRRGSSNLLRDLNNDIRRLKKAEIDAIRARNRARNAKRAKDLKGVRLATKIEQNIYLKAINDLQKFEARVRRTKVRKFKEPTPGAGEKIIKTRTGQLQIVKVKTITKPRVRVKLKRRVRARLVPIVILRPRAKVSLNARVKARAIRAARLRNLRSIKVRVVARTRIVPRTVPKQALKPREVQRVLTKPREVQILVTRTTPRFALRLRARQRIALRPRVKTRVRFKERVALRVKERLLPILIPGAGPVSVEAIVRSKGPFNVIVRSRGRKVKINKFPLTGSQALALGGRFADNNAVRSFAIVKTKGKTRKIKVARFNKAKFRKPSGNTKLERFFLVEKTKFAIDTPGEKRQISRKGIAAPRRKKRKVRRKRRKR